MTDVEKSLKGHTTGTKTSAGCATIRDITTLLYNHKPFKEHRITFLLKEKSPLSDSSLLFTEVFSLTASVPKYDPGLYANYEITLGFISINEIDGIDGVLPFLLLLHNSPHFFSSFYTLHLRAN
ncbi:BA75_04765T0 [Komagataella pastoris]|uniref:BA75_04765T0 n=1 Tax=Komagataella pastoris TaxID=4922 RepID=A0A1B2JH01_PICPA|nr:BA75_04765T0 [Komagataella pastoris]